MTLQLPLGNDLWHQAPVTGDALKRAGLDEAVTEVESLGRRVIRPDFGGERVIRLGPGRCQAMIHQTGPDTRSGLGQTHEGADIAEAGFEFLDMLEAKQCFP